LVGGKEDKNREGEIMGDMMDKLDYIDISNKDE